MHASDPGLSTGPARRRVATGEPFILSCPPRHHHLLYYTPGGSFGTNLGQVVYPEEMYYGQTIESSLGHPFQVLMPSLAERQMKVKRRTTIIYPKDAGYMLLQTGVRAGSRVLECGGGSGAFTFLLACAVGTDGTVHSFERRPEHLEQAQANLRRLGDFPQIEWHLRDTEREGFGLEGMEAVFIDVPEPWTLVAAARSALLPGAFWVSLSPSVNQVERTVLTLEAAGFTALRTVEILERELLVREGKTRPREMGITHTAYITTARLADRPSTPSAAPPGEEAPDEHEPAE
jgi:tRNA (adenine57-N1/adenine58-N1)-methyltransferase